MACGSGTRERAKSRGLRGQSCLDPLEIVKGGELVCKYYNYCFFIQHLNHVNE